jgi:hypothetical protein
MALFEKGHSIKSGGRKGIKHRLSTAFLKALADDFEADGIEAIRICRVERPHEYLRVIAHLMPRDMNLEITDSRLQEISDNELDSLIDLARQRRAINLNPNGREDQTVDGEPVKLLSTLPTTD